MARPAVADALNSGLMPIKGVTMIRVLILSDIRLYREGLMELLGRRDDIAVVGTATTWADGEPQIAALQPDVVLLDMAIPDSDAVARMACRMAPSSRIVALGVHEIEGDLVRCAEAGIAGYVRRDGSLQDLIASVESASRGEWRSSAEVMAQLLRRLARLTAERSGSDQEAPLTGRERQIVNLIERGLSNKEIAHALGIEVATVKNHVHNLLEKFHVHRRSEAARMARTRAEPPRGARS
jgi:DNA-binding NarL/FixJ family response regulator